MCVVADCYHYRRMTVEEKLIIFWNDNQLGESGNTDKKWNLFRIGFFKLYFPNLGQRGYLLHDVNHLLSGYGIDWFSEFQIAAWELGSGRRKGFYLSNFYPIVGFFLGLVSIPKRTLNAYKKGKNRVNAHILSHKENVLGMEFDDLVLLSNRNKNALSTENQPFTHL